LTKNIRVITVILLPLLHYEELEDTKGIIRIRKSKDRATKWPIKKVQNDKQRSTKHYA